MKKNISFLFPGKSRFERLDDSLKGNSPKEFFYGFLSLKSEDYNLSMIDTHTDPKYFTNKVFLKYEQYRNSFFNFGITKQRVLAIAESIKSVDTVICFTDAFSLSLGLYGKKYAPNTILIGGFHGLADLADETKNIPKQYINMIIQRCIKNLNHLFFFGEADRIESIKKYKIDPNKTSLFRFGVDVKFWTPKKINTKTKTIFSVGSDPKRDYKTLVNSSRDYKINILTKLKISNLQNFSNVSIVSGNYHNSIITDDHLKNLYRQSTIVVVPVRDVFQPSGYSVTLQAMSCGKTVILSDIKGLWDKNIFVSGENCVLVPPEDALSLEKVIKLLMNDDELNKKISYQARKTALKYFSLERMNTDIKKLINIQ